MKRTLTTLTAFAALALASVDAQTHGWVGYAAAPDGRVYRFEGGTEYSARESARAQCETQTLLACNAISVQRNSYVFVTQCDFGGRRESFLGGSNINMGAALWLAHDKASKAGFVPNHDCIEVYRF